MSATVNGTAAPLSIDERMEIGAKMSYSANPIKSFGPYILGMWIDAILLGCLICLFIEWRRYAWPTEKKPTRFLVCYLLLTSFTISCYVMASQMFLFVQGFGVYKNFLNPSWYRVAWILNSFSRIPTAAFFTHRAWLISGKSVFVPLAVVPLLLTSLGCSWGAFITSKSIPIKLDSVERVFVVIFVGTELAADVINTTTIAWGLYRSRTGWKSTDRMIGRLFIILAETQLPPTLVALGFLICFVGFPNNRAIFLFAGIGKVHTLCLVVVLSSRVRMQAVDYSQQSYPMVDTPNVTDETYVHYDDNAPNDDKFNPAGSTVDSKGVMRTVNGRALGQHRNSYREFDSESSLVVTHEA